MKYDHANIEKKWQKFWEDNEIFRVSVDASKPKYYILDMFPYPSGSGLHVGHVTGYTATDILARYKRQKGFNVLHPMGWDSFGLPAEQYAIRTGTHPSITTQKNIDTYRKQLKSLGFSYDWSREIATSDPNYYKWTQWIFTKLYEKGLAYEAEVLVNYCPKLGTVLANEEVENGKAKDGGYLVERRPLRQWMLKITAYAERLLADLDTIDWPDHLKRLQTNWIGKSEGALVDFSIIDSSSKISVFTTCAHTIFGISYLVISPEHPILNAIVAKTHKQSVDQYKKEIASKSDLERTDLNENKTGVWTGAFAVNPVNGEPIPIWVSDYVLMGYGTGAVMGVPAHDERDFIFAKTYQLPIKKVVQASDEQNDECWTGDGLLVNSSSMHLTINGLDVESAKKAVILWLENSCYGSKHTSYKLRDWLFSRQRYWGEPFPVLHFEDGSKRCLSVEELPLLPPMLADFKPTGEGESPLAKVKEWMNVFDPLTKKVVRRESNTMPQWAGSCWYYLRFCDPLNESKAWGEEEEKYWMPVDLYVGGVEHAVLHLLYARFWHKVLFDCGLVSTNEPFQCLRNQGLVTSRSYHSLETGYLPEDQVIEKEGEFFEKSTLRKMTTQIEKMSKSKLNGVTPDEIIEEYGADTLRLYEMFMGPFEKEKLWNTEAVTGCRRFLNRFYDLITSSKVSDEECIEANRLGHRLVHGVEKDIESMQFNTAISKMMEFINGITALNIYPKKILKMAVQTLAPFAPHIAEEAWELLGESQSLSFTPFPSVDPQFLEEDTVMYVVQVNGKLRGRWLMPKDKTQEELLEFIRSQPMISKHIIGDIKKVVYVPNKLINLVL
ncbi:MAG: leucine--tRNA ligase [Rhabdochlamydiaceae bacterium]